MTRFATTPLEGRGTQSVRVSVREYHNDEWANHDGQDDVSEESPIALIYNGISHAVMMATPACLTDFAVGFSLTEGIIDEASDIFYIETVDHGEAGVEMHLHIHGRCMNRLQQRRRSLTGATGCGLCGLESLEQLQLSFPPAPFPALPPAVMIHRALIRLHERQKLQQLTGTIHAASWCNADGSIEWLREDVGRHNALDKLIGALARNEVDTRQGFALVSSRGSYEMVAKAAQARLGTLVTISGVTAMAIRMAEQAGLNLIGFARRGRQVVYASAASSANGVDGGLDTR